MTDHPFRFGIVGGQLEPAEAIVATARGLESRGYDILLIPDTLRTVAPGIGCAVAAAGTSTLRVGTHVLSAPNRTPGLVAVETVSLHAVSGGRFELGIGAGRPGADRDAAALGMPFGSAAERIGRLEQTIEAVREQAPEVPIMVAARGPKMLAIAARTADAVTMGVPPATGPDGLAAVVRTLREQAGERIDQIELAQNLLAVGDEVPPWVLQYAGTDLAGLRSVGSVALLSGTPVEMAAVLRRRRDELGISYFSTSLAFADALAPVVELLAGT
ncbi:LLM class flavin-dependent oxidoreductase [Nakamurella lactea]|uniref:LLM class flavin-dependent oxidoreductase n=1 Tax=Nakamurella lactea TaxID=459515 RepID=UPI00049182AD|nr:LLM class flavin-dependent oxidoreductase [Nakamurella lactea]